MARTTIRLPGTDGPDIQIERGLFERTTVRVAGQVVPRLPLRNRSYAIPLADGMTHTIVLDHTSTGLEVVTEDGTRIPAGPVTPMWMTIVLILPFLLFFCGLIGALVGAAGVGINGLIARTDRSLPLKVLAMLIVLAVAIVAWVVAAGAFLRATDPTFAVGDCVRGLASIGQDIEDASSVHQVDCAETHEGRVIGLSYLPGGADAPFPGQTTVAAHADSACMALFAEFHGVSYLESTIEMVMLQPSPDTWASGDREIVCISLEARTIA
jgi:hypothetical protein